MIKNISSRWVAVLFSLLTIVGLLTAGDYGLPLDGPSERVILQENIKEYYCLLFGEDSEKVQGYDALGVQRITESIEMDHGQAAYYLAVPLFRLKNTDPYLFNVLWHMYTWLLFMIGVLAVYRIGRELGMNRFLAFCTALLLALSPRFFAEGHYNSKDVVLLSLSLWTIAEGVRFLKKQTVPRALLFALAGAMAANLRIIGFFVFGVMGITVIVTLAARRELRGKALRNGLLAIVGFAAVYVLITPAFLVEPAKFVTHLISNSTAFSRWTGVVLFKGAVYDPTGGQPLPHSYLPTMIAVTVPEAVLALDVLGAVYAVRLCIKKDARRPVLIALMVLFILPVAYAVLARPLMYNGWRHFYFLYGPMIVMAGLGLVWLQTLLAGSRIGKIAGVGALALVFLWQGIGIACNHPYEYAYYNTLAGDAQSEFELDYWELSTLNAMQQLAAGEDRNPDLPLTLGSNDPLSLYSLKQSVQTLPNEIREEFTITDEETPPYLFSNATYAQMYSQSARDDYRVLFTIESYGSVICTMYEKLE